MNKRDNRYDGLLFVDEDSIVETELSHDLAMNKCDNRYGGLLFHGSPKNLDKLEKESWVTFNKEIARAWSHEPTRLCTNTCFRTMKHNGVVPGFLYVIDEEVDDLELIEHSSDKTLWLIRGP